MGRPRLPPSERKQYFYKSFYFPGSDPRYNLVWSFFENMISDITNPNSPRYNPKLIKGTIIRRLIFKYIVGEIEKRNCSNQSDEVCEEVVNAIRDIINEENAKIQMRVERRGQVRA